MGRLTTHVLDTGAGRPAAGIAIEVHRDGELVTRAVTDDDGRTAAPLVDGVLEPGAYEIVFDVSAHFTRSFYDRIPVRVVIDDPDGHYHVPLLVSPWSYSTYRGS